MSTPPSVAAANDTGLFKVNFNPFLPVTRGCGTGPTRICSPPTSLCVDVVSVSPWLSDFHSTRFLTAPGGGCAGFEWWAGRAVSAHAAAVVAGSPGFVNGGGGTQLSADAPRARTRAQLDTLGVSSGGSIGCWEGTEGRGLGTSSRWWPCPNKFSQDRVSKHRPVPERNEPSPPFRGH